MEYGTEHGMELGTDVLTFSERTPSNFLGTEKMLKWNKFAKSRYRSFYSRNGNEFLNIERNSFDNIVTSTPKSDLKRDIRYSLEVWIPADKVKVFHNLNINEKEF